MQEIGKDNFLVSKVRRYLEPVPAVLVSSAFEGGRDIVTMGWHTMMEFSTSLVGCVISRATTVTNQFAKVANASSTCRPHLTD